MRFKGEGQLKYVLERLDNFVHVNDLTRVGLEWKLDIDASYAVDCHLSFFRKSPEMEKTLLLFSDFPAV